MKKLLVVCVMFVVSLYIEGCNGDCGQIKEDRATAQMLSKGFRQFSDGRWVKIVTMEGCEYIHYYGPYIGDIYIHKGNCTNHIAGAR